MSDIEVTEEMIKAGLKHRICGIRNCTAGVHRQEVINIYQAMLTVYLDSKNEIKDLEDNENISL